MTYYKKIINRIIVRTMYNLLHDILQNILYNICDENDSIIIYLNSEFHILENFSHIIKKKMLYINLITYDNNTLYHKLFENIRNEDCEKNINVFMNVRELKLKDKKINKLFICDLNNSDDFLKILNDINSKIEMNYQNNNNSDNNILDIRFFLYCYLSNEKNKKRFIKNTLINNFQDISKNIAFRFGLGHDYVFDKVLYMHDILKIIDDCKMDIIKINSLKNVNYFLIGNYIFYEIAFISKIKNNSI